MKKNIKIGSNIKRIRKEKNLTQEQLAELINLSSSFISRLERSNDQNISVKTLIAISSSLQVDINELFLNEEKRQSQKGNSFQSRMLMNEINNLNPDEFDLIKKLVSEISKK